MASLFKIRNKYIFELVIKGECQLQMIFILLWSDSVIWCLQIIEYVNESHLDKHDLETDFEGESVEKDSSVQYLPDHYSWARRQMGRSQRKGWPDICHPLSITHIVNIVCLYRWLIVCRYISRSHAEMCHYLTFVNN